MRAAPRPHANRLAPAGLAAFGLLDHLGHLNQLLALECGGVVNGLRAILAILWTSARFNRQQGRYLNLIGVEMRAMRWQRERGVH